MRELINLPAWIVKACEQHEPKLELRLAMSYEFRLTALDLIALHLWRWN